MIRNWQYHNPVKIISGIDSIIYLNSFITKGNWLLVTSSGFSKRGMTELIKNQLKGVNLLIYDSVSPNPQLDELEYVTLKFRNKSIEGIIAIGGGSVLDAAKVLSVTICSNLETPLKSILRESILNEWRSKLPIIVIPTTSGTGAEVTPFATVWDKPQRKKYSIVGDKVFPDIALLDPKLTLTLPYYETLYTGLDTISHALESLWNVSRNPISEMYAEQALILSSNALLTLTNNLNDLEARNNMQQASLFSGLAITQTRTAIAHSISYPITSHFDVPHGLACSFTLPSLIEEYLNFYPKEKHKKLFETTKELIESFELHNYISNYASELEILSKISEMFHPDRAGNFIMEADEKFIAKQIKKSLSYYQ